MQRPHRGRATRWIIAKAPTCNRTCASSSGCASTPTSCSNAATPQDDTSLWDWYKNIHNGVPDRRNVTIILMNEERQPVMRWHAENAWINKIEGPSFKASGNEVAIESVELVHEGSDHRGLSFEGLAVQSPQTPGVYYERVDASAPAISLLRTDIAGFVGIATRGPLHQPLPVQSWRQFQAYFGDFTGAGYLAYAVRAFFENGGQRCWVVRVASEVAGDRRR